MTAEKDADSLFALGASKADPQFQEGPGNETRPRGPICELAKALLVVFVFHVLAKP